VVVLPSLADPDAKLTPKQLDLLTEDIRTIVARTLPNTAFNLLKQDEVMKKLGDQAFVRACKEGVCVGSLVESVDANFGARCEIYTVNQQSYMKFELYGTLKGQTEAGTIDQFNDPVKNFADMQAKIKAKVPGMFEMIIKSPQEICEAKGREWTWANGACKSSMQIVREACEAVGNTWINGECKSKAQITCEVMAGRKWTGEECKTLEQIECEKKDGRWESGVCRSNAQIDMEESKDYSVYFESSPMGALLNFNGKTSLCITPCKAKLKKGSVKVQASLDLYDAKDTTISVQANDSQRVHLNLDRNYGTLNIKTKGDGWNLMIENKPFSLNDVRLLPGTHEIKLTHPCYDDISIKANVKKGEDEVLDLSNDAVFKCGTLEIKSEYGRWNLGIGGNDNKFHDLQYADKALLLPGTYKIHLRSETPQCYEDIDFNAEIKKGETRAYDVFTMITPRTANLALYVQYKGRDREEPVFIDGMEVGKTPFKKPIPACSKKVEFGKDKLQVNLDSLKLGGVEYTHKLPTLKSTLLSLAIGLASGVFLYNAYALNADANYYMDEYNNLSSGKISEYDRNRKSAKDAKDKVPFYLISGGVLAVSAVGVYIWF